MKRGNRSEEYKKRIRTPTYRSWDCMHQRCRNTNNSRYEHYGARGISVCERWSFFQNFLEDMGERPSGKSLDRIDFDKGYSKENCKWADAKEQCHNRRCMIRDEKPYDELLENYGVNI